MSYFPMFVELKNKNVLIVGGGKVALRKLEKLIPYGAYITVAAPEIDPEILSAGASDFIMASFSASMLKGQDMVIAATNDRKLNHRISSLCRDRKIPVNVVDDREECSFLFPSLIKKGKMSIGICTGGASPTAAIWCRERVEEMLPDSLPRLIEYLDSLRPVIRDRVDTEEVRARIFKELFTRCMELQRDLTQEELTEIIEGAKVNG